LIAPALVGALGFALVPSAPSAGVAIAMLSLAAGGAISCAALFWSLPTAFLSGAAAAAGIAIINSVGNLAGFAAPSMIGVVTDATGSSEIGMYVIAGGLIVGAFGVWRTPARMVNR
jgi:cyanate permease